MKDIKVSVNSWYVVEGTAGATVTNPSTNRVIATIEEGKQASFYATTPYVLASDDSVSVYKTTFNSAPVKLRLLGLLGGGASTGSGSALPAGYIAAEFLEATGTQYINTGIVPAGKIISAFITAQYINFQQNFINGLFGAYKTDNVDNMNIGVVGGKWRVKINNLGSYGTNFDTLPHRFVFNADDGTKVGEEILLNAPPQRGKESNTLFCFLFAINAINLDWEGKAGVKRVFDALIKNDGISALHYVAAISPNGAPCMYDKVSKQPFYNAGSGQFIVGLNTKQALKLSKLPAGGGSLTISLPTGYESDAGVVSALETARATGWTLTVQTYTPEEEASSVATFGMRRIWVRKVQEENGVYVDADGTRYTVDWCVEMYTPDNSTPDMHGYELFRSVEAAVAYWELQPWVDPEAEELLTEYNANE